MTNASCSPTWAQPSPDGKSIYVACNKSDEIVEVDADSWSLRRRIPSGPGVYNLAISKDGKMLATNKRGQSVSVFELDSGTRVGAVTNQAQGSRRCCGLLLTVYMHLSR